MSWANFYSKLYAGNEAEEKIQNTLSHDIRADDEEKKQR